MKFSSLKMRAQKGFTLLQLMLTTVVMTGVLGWILNIVELAKLTEFSGMVVLRAIGIPVAPLGAVLGFI